MRHSGEKVCLIIPCYNEAKRIRLDEFQQSCGESLRLIFVDDGSTDKTKELLESRISPFWHVVHLSRNEGKAEAVRQGILHAQKQSFFSETNWIGYWDADLSTPLREIKNYLLYRSVFYPDSRGIFGSRVKRLGSHISRKPLRHYFGRIFATLTSLFFRLSAYDTQCGAKLFHVALANEAFQKPFMSKWLFDIEIFLRLKTYQVIEYPLQNWEDAPGSKIKLLPTLINVFPNLIKIYRGYKIK